MTRALVVGVTLALAAFSACGAHGEWASAPAPNLVVIVADDLGWGEVGYQGGQVPTPHLDALAREGVVLERFYAQPICSAARAALLTGRNPMRTGMAGAVITPWRRFGLPPEERTLPEALAGHGYAQRAAIGKWHLGHLERRWHPLSQGFTEFRGHYNGAVDHVTHEREGQVDWHADHEPLREEGYATRLQARAAAEFIERAADDGRLVCYVAFSAVHAPFQAPAETLERFAHLSEPDGTVGIRQARAAMVAELDDAVGVVLEALDDAGIADDTLVWFVGDNGAGPEQLDANAPLRGHKGTLYEGALRVPAVVRWPRGLPAGRREDGVASICDVFATSVVAAGGAPDGGAGPLDGVDLRDVLAGARRAPRRTLRFFYGQDGPDDEQVAVLTPSWKLVARGRDVRLDESAGALALDLFAIESDPHERRDVSGERPDVVEQLLRAARAYRDLEPQDAAAPYWEGYQGFRAPVDWRIPDAD